MTRTQAKDAIEYGARRIIRCARHFVDLYDPGRRVRVHDIGKRTPDIDTNEFHQLPRILIPPTRCFGRVV